MILLLGIFLSVVPANDRQGNSPLPDTLYLEEACVKERKHASGVLEGSRVRTNIGRGTAQLLQEISSVYVKNYGIGQLSTLAIRGTSASQSLVSWNGVNLNSVFLGQSDLSLYPIGLHQAYELDLSPNAGTIGGRFNLINGPIFEPKTEWRFLGRYGSFGTYSNLFDFSFSNTKIYSSTRFFHQQSKNNFPYTDPSDPERRKTQQQNGAWNQLSVMQDIGLRLHPTTYIQASFWYNRSYRQIPNIFQTSNKEFQKDENYRGQVMLVSEWKKQRVSVNTTLIRDQLFYENPSSGIQANSISLTTRNRVNWVYSPLSFLQIHTEAGADHERAETDGYERFITRNIFFGDVHIRLGIPRVKSLQLMAGYRHEAVGDIFSPPMPYLQLKWNHHQRGQETEIRVRGGRNFRAPTLNDLYWREGGNTSLEPEKSWNTEITTGWSPGKWLKMNLAGYYMLIDNYIQWTPQSGGIWRPENVRQVTHFGGEYSLSGQVRSAGSNIRFTYFASYSYCRTFSIGEIENQFIYVPRHKLNAFTEISVYDFFLKPFFSFTDRRETRTNNRPGTALPSYFLLHLEAGKTFYLGPHEMMCAFTVQNVTATDYQEIAGRPMRGRSFECTLRLRFSHEKK